MRPAKTRVPPLDDASGAASGTRHPPAAARRAPALTGHPEFSDRTLAELLAALHARTTGHPDSPGLIACWPGVREARMAAACGELRRRGHPVFRLSIPGIKAGQTRYAWAISAPSDEPVIRL
jgi:hypothetical protein